MNLSDKSLAKNILIQEQNMGIGGFYEDVKQYFAELNIDMSDAQKLSISSFKRMVKERALIKNRNYILFRAKPNKKRPSIYEKRRNFNLNHLSRQ